MNARIFYLGDQILLGRSKSDVLSYLTKTLFAKGLRIDEIKILPTIPPSDFDNITKLESKQNLFVYLLEAQNAYTQIIDKLCSKLGVEKVQSNIAKTVIQTRNQSKNIPTSKESEQCQFVPSGAYVVGNIFSDIQCVVVSDKNDYYLLMPSTKQEVSTYLEKMLSYIMENQPKYQQNQIFRTFGLSAQNIKQVLQDLIKNKDKISINVFSDGLDGEIIIRSKTEQPLFHEYVGKVFSRLTKFIYAEESISMEQTLLRLLKNSNLSLSIGESITHGNITNKLCSNPEFSQHIKSTYIFQESNNICDHISAKTSTVQNFGGASVEAVYEISSNIINQSQSDIVCAVVGKYENESCQSFIAVGDKNTIHVYKNTFFGSFDEVVESTTKATLLYLIKKLRQNDFHFDKKTV